MNLKYLRPSTQRYWVLFIGIVATSLYASNKNLDIFFQGGYAFIFIIFVSTVTTLLIGMLPGVGALSGLFVAMCYFFIPPFNSFEIENKEALLSSLFSFTLGMVIIFLISWIKKDAKSFMEHH